MKIQQYRIIECITSLKGASSKAMKTGKDVEKRRQLARENKKDKRPRYRGKEQKQDDNYFSRYQKLYATRTRLTIRAQHRNNLFSI